MVEDRKEIIEALGGDAMVKKMDHEQRAEALEEYLIKQLHVRSEEPRLNPVTATSRMPSSA